MNKILIKHFAQTSPSPSNGVTHTTGPEIEKKRNSQQKYLPSLVIAIYNNIAQITISDILSIVSLSILYHTHIILTYYFGTYQITPNL